MGGEEEPAIRCETTQGPVDIVLRPDWSPRGAERFVELVESGHFEDMPLFRCVHGFLCQFGYKEGAPHWGALPDDPFGPGTPKRFRRGFVSFAGNGKNSRSSHLFVTLGEDVSSLGREPWETPIGYVTDKSMAEVVSIWTTKYGDMAPWGKGPEPGKIAAKGGSVYLKQTFPELDYIKSCGVLPRSSQKVKDVPNSRGASATNQLVVLDLAPNLGKVVVELLPEWAPLGVERMIQMTETEFLDEARFFRVVPGFVVQFGMPANPSHAKRFPAFKDEPVKGSNTRGTISFATSGPDSRSFQLFINLGNNQRLDGMQFSPIGRVIEGMEYVDQINSEYREKPNQGEISRNGNEYLEKNFPRLSYIKSAYLLGENHADNSLKDTYVIDERSRSGLLELSFALSMLLLLVLAFVLTIRLIFKTYPSAKARN